MNGTGFLIRTIRAIGANLPKAEVTFQDGLNVITGASETGKTYILQCIDYMLGGQTPPKDVDEGKGYETLLLEYEVRGSGKAVLERSLRSGGDFRHYSIPLEQWVQNVGFTELHQSHDADREDTVSHLFLTLSGLAGAMLLESASGKNKSVSFRDICRFSIIREGDIIADRSPILAGDRYFKDPVCVSMFGIFLTGRDYRSVIAAPDIKVNKAKWQANTELLGELIEEVNRQAAIAIEDPVGLRAKIREFEEQIESATSTVDRTIAAINTAVANRQEQWRSAAKLRTRLAVVEQLLQRFALLDDHYKSDLERLQFLVEGEHYLSQLGTIHCPVCGKLMDDHTKDELKADSEKKTNIQRAAKAEILKITIHINDLEKTTHSLNEEQAQLREAIAGHEKNIATAENEIKDNLDPQIKALKKTIEDATRAKADLAISEFNRQRGQDLMDRREALGKEPRQKKVKLANAAAIDTGELRKFCDRVENILRAWKLPDVGTVEFAKKWQIVVGGKSTFGKGYIALIRTAFTIALMQHALGKNRHPGMSVIDSPLTSFKQQDSYQMDADVKVAFYKNLLVLPENQQVIIIENESPPAEVESRLAHTHFSRTIGQGRYGFFPFPRNGTH